MRIFLLKYSLLVVALLFVNLSKSQGLGIDILLQELEQSESQEEKIDKLLHIGELYASVNVDSSISYLEMAYHLGKLGEDSEQLYKITNALGYMYEDVDRVKSAQYYYECLAIVEKREDREKLLPVIWMNLGTLHRKNDEFEKAHEFYTQALDARKAEGDSLGIAECLNNIGTAYMANDQLEEGLENWNRALGIKRRMGDDLSAANTLLNLGIYYKDTFDYDKAFEYAHEAIIIFRKHGHLENLANSHALLGDTWFGVKNWKKAIQNYDKANDIFISLNLDVPRIDVLKGLGTALYEDGQTDRARKVFGQWQYQFTAFQKDESNRHVIEIATKYETEKTERENALLKKENELREIQNQAALEEVKRKDAQRNFLIVSVAFLLALIALLAYITIQRKKSNQVLKAQKDLVQEKNDQIEQSLKEKEVLLKEIHHRVKNNLEIISSLIELQSADINDQKTADVFTSWQNRINSIALIHKDLYKTDDFVLVQLQDYFDNLIGNISTVYGGMIKIEMTVEPGLSLHIDQTIPLGLIVNELVSNAFKHAFKDGAAGVINISIHNYEADEVIVTVADNGSGLPKDYKTEESDSLGLRLVKILSRQINADFNMLSEKGTKASIKFKKHEAN